MNAFENITLAAAKLNDARRQVAALQKALDVKDPLWRQLEDIDDKIFDALVALGD